MLASLSRQNGIVVVMAVVGLMLYRCLPLSGLKQFLLIATSACASAIAVFAASTFFFQAVGVRSVHPERMLYVYDLAAMSDLTGRDLFPPLLIAHHSEGWVTPYVTPGALKRDFRWENLNLPLS